MRLHKSLLVVSAASFLFALSACKPQPQGVQGNGQIATDNRSVDSFNSVEFQGDFQVTLVSGKPQQISITTDKNLLPYIVSTVKKQGLLIGPQEGVTIAPTAPVQITISAPEIDAIGMVGNGSVNATGLQNHATLLLVQGNGTITAAGKTQNASIHINGNGTIDAKQLPASGKVMIATKGGTVIVTANGELHAVTDGGKITYYGSPQVKQNTINNGQISAGQ